MENNNFDINLIKKRMLRKYPSFGYVINNTNYKICDDENKNKYDFYVKTAATDGKDIYVNKDFIGKLNENQQVFAFAHEVCHIALNHVMRGEGKNSKLWNIATDAVINAYLQKDGLEKVDNIIEIENAINFDAETLYKKLKDKQDQQENQENQEQKTNQNNQNSAGDQQNNNNDASTENGHDQHDLWAYAREEAKQNNKTDAQEEKSEESEKKAFEKNEKEKIRRAEEVISKIKSGGAGIGGAKENTTFGKVGQAKPVLSWKKILKRELEEEDEAWGHKFSDSDNDYRARIEDVEFDEQPQVEIILDVSGSIDFNLLKCFLKQVKTILKNSKVKVGTFSDNFSGFVDIKKIDDIDKMVINYGGGTNYDCASRAFSKRKDVNKICFTDGDDMGAVKIKEKRNDIIWISFENRYFKPDNGKVIYVPRSKIENLETETKKDEELTF